MSITTVVVDTAVEELKKQIRGELIRTGEPSYESARKFWNGMIDRRPAVIVRCSGVAYVIDPVDFARDSDVPLAVGGGSHGAAGLAMCDDGLVVDLSGLNVSRVD